MWINWNINRLVLLLRIMLFMACVLFKYAIVFPSWIGRVLWFWKTVCNIASIFFIHFNCMCSQWWGDYHFGNIHVCDLTVCSLSKGPFWLASLWLSYVKEWALNVVLFESGVPSSHIYRHVIIRHFLIITLGPPVIIHMPEKFYSLYILQPHTWKTIISNTIVICLPQTMIACLSISLH